MRSVLLVAALLGGAVFAYPAAADGDKKSGRYRIVLMNNREVVGELKEVPGGYEIKTRSGITIKLTKAEIRRMEALDPPKNDEAGGDSENPVADRLARITDEDILEILGDDVIEEEDLEHADADLSPLPLDEESLAEMRRIAGSGADIWPTDHFVLVYTSDRTMARKLGARLESVYKWCHMFMDRVGIQPVRPEYKLEIYFYNTHEEFDAYGNNQGGIPEWAAGFYIPTVNRSAFYDLNDSPDMANLKKRLERAHWRRKRYWNNRITRFSEFFNKSVIQHEAAHHIHFNVGIFPKRARPPRFLGEGLAQMFELPPGKLGGGLGTTNYYRLAELNHRFRRNPGAMIPTRQFVVDDATGWPAAYPQAWALTHYLWKKERPKFSLYMQKMANREDGATLSGTQRQQEFEDIFGPADELHKKFVEYIFSLQNRPSALDI